ncbi:MAG: HmuY family protein [Muribaculaceae bacterium]|nr:HmuY family protein [Muribaculaceae bacterium]
MKPITLATYLIKSLALLTVVTLSGCEGIFKSVYDEPESEPQSTTDGHLYIDASNWQEWHYIDLRSVAEHVATYTDFNPSSLWETIEIPTLGIPEEFFERNNEKAGLYTYWYDVFGEGISNQEFIGFTPTEPQPEPDQWTFAVHRNNVRTNGCLVAETEFSSLSQIPDDSNWVSTLVFTPDEWNQTEVWTVQDRMLNGIIGNQGIYINKVLSGWLKMLIPPMPPLYEINCHVFVLKLTDGSFAALQLEDYMNSSGTKCCLSINYKYPL